VFVCDSFNAMISQHPFGEAKSEAQALRELRDCAGSQFDPRVVDAFMAEHAARRAAVLAEDVVEPAVSAAGAYVQQ
jgi:response regulator RpfG family c-di-GMP phosphodiesterase